MKANFMNIKGIKLSLFLIIIIQSGLYSQGRLEDYKRADKIRSEFSDKVFNANVRATWIDESHSFWYINTIPEGKEFIIVDSDKVSKNPAFDHKKMAESLSKSLDKTVDPYKLPFNRI